MNSLSKIFIAGFLLFIFCIQMQAQTDETDVEQRLKKMEDDISRLNKVRILGYIQTQFSWGEKDAALGVGTPNENPEKSFSRFGIRRGRIRLEFEENILSGVFQLNFSERGINIRDVFLQIKDPIWETNALRTGIFHRPFSYAINYSSATRESLERATIITTLFPNSRALGTMLTLQASENSPWNILKFDAGLFTGNGVNEATNSRMDFSGRLSGEKNMGNIMLNGGLSYYNGGVFQSTANVYTMNGKGFELNQNIDNIGKYAKR